VVVVVQEKMAKKKTRSIFEQSSDAMDETEETVVATAAISTPIIASSPTTSDDFHKYLSYVFVFSSDWTADKQLLFQPARTFHLSGLLPRSSKWCMILERFIWTLALVSSMIADAVVYDTILQPQQDHVKWIMLPTNWVNLLVLFYFLLLLYMGYMSKVEYESLVETAPISVVYAFIHNLFHILLPLTGTIFVANYTVMKMLDEAYLATLWIAFLSFVFDAFLGSYPACVRLFTICPLMIFMGLVYTAILQLGLGIQLYAALNWVKDPSGALYRSLSLLVCSVCFGVVWYILLAAKNEWKGIRHYRHKEIKNPKRKDGSLV
jgi:hypothetical protein